MQLWVIDVLTLQLLCLPVYLLGLVSFFLIHLHRRAVLLGAGIRISSDHVAVYSLYHVVSLAAPHILLCFLLISSIRTVEMTFCASQLYLNAWALRYGIITLSLSSLALAVFSLSQFKTTLPYVSEILLCLLWIFWIFFWVLLVTNLAIFIFFLEILGLLLLTALLYIFVIVRRQVHLVALNFKLFNASYGSKFLFIQTLLFFLWSSAISMLLLFWGCLFIGVGCLSLELSLLELAYTFATLSSFAPAQFGGAGVTSLFFVLFFFFFALLLKGAVVPLQLWLIIFYRYLPVAGLFTYLIFYYVYFIMVTFNLLFGYLYAFGVVWSLCGAVLFGIGTIFTLLNIGEALMFRSFLAYSSVINLFFLFVFLLVTM